MSVQKRTIVRAVRGLALPLSWWAPELAALWLRSLFLTPRARRSPSRERDWLDRAWHRQLSIGDSRVSLYSWGRGPTVLLAHGWAGRAGQLGALVGPLLERGRRVVAYDAPAHGASPGSRTNLLEMAETLVAVANEVGPVEAVVAHSLGSAACAVALSEGLDPSRVVFVAPPAEPSAFLAATGRLFGFTEDVIERARRLIERTIRRPLRDFDTVGLAPSSARPLLVVHDEGDRFVPMSDGRAVAAAWPGARLEVTRGLGHERVLWDEGVVNTIVDFVAQTTRTSDAARTSGC